MQETSPKDSISLAELAEILGMSRIAVFKKVKQGLIPASKVGRSYRIFRKDVPEILGRTLSAKERTQIKEAVQLTVRDYRETLKLLGRE